MKKKTDLEKALGELERFVDKLIQKYPEEELGFVYLVMGRDEFAPEMNGNFNTPRLLYGLKVLTHICMERAKMLDPEGYQEVMAEEMKGFAEAASRMHAKAQAHHQKKQEESHWRGNGKPVRLLPKG